MKLCKWTGRPECLFVEEGIKVYTNAPVEPFELCDGPKRIIPGLTYWFNNEEKKMSELRMPSYCQPGGLGFGSPEEFDKYRKTPDKLTHYI